jgi:NAD(P)-dependent dehydrogenase (short-subunit alcohol dehydrogenase family)
MPSNSGPLITGQTFSTGPLGAIDLSKKRVAIFGGTGGIGRALARAMVQQGARVSVVGQTFRDSGVNGLTFVGANLESLSECIRIAKGLAVEELDLVVFTTGIFAGPRREETTEGIERDLAVSFLSRYAILREIGPRIGKSRPTPAPKARVFIMGFPGTNAAGDIDDLNSEKKYGSMSTHMNTVAGNEALVVDAARRYPQLNIFGLNPGIIRTNIRSNILGGTGSARFRIVEGLIGLFNISAEEYARRLVPLFFSTELEAASGALFNRTPAVIARSAVMTDSYVARFMDASERLVQKALSVQG